MPIRLAIHVGPHKTGSTSAQRALAAARQRLAAEGVWYPESVAGAQWPEQHADAWRLVARGRAGEFDAWLEGARLEAAERRCDTLFLSSENFQAPGTRRALDRVLRRWRREGPTQLLWVHRDTTDLAASRAASFITGEAGFYYLHRHDLRRWARRFALAQERHRRWFTRRGARIVPLDGHDRSTLAARLLETATGRPFAWVVTGDHHVTATRLADARAVMGYALRVMHHHATGADPNEPAAFAAVQPLLPEIADETAFAELASRFHAAVRREVAAGVADFERLGPLGRQWLVWFDRSAPRRG